jgi:hypothetical protein
VKQAQAKSGKTRGAKKAHQDALCGLAGSDAGDGVGNIDKTPATKSGKTRCAKSAAPVVAVVKRRFAINQRLLLCECDTGDQIRVRVRDSGMFNIGQKIPVTFPENSIVWLLDCPQPHMKGRLSWKA